LGLALYLFEITAENEPTVNERKAQHDFSDVELELTELSRRRGRKQW
jgi:hypothetical protein